MEPDPGRATTPFTKAVRRAFPAMTGYLFLGEAAQAAADMEAAQTNFQALVRKSVELQANNVSIEMVSLLVGVPILELSLQYEDHLVRGTE